MSLTVMYEIQRVLSRYQAKVLVGPMVMSPLKGLFSVAQLLVGIFGVLFFGLLSAILILLDFAHTDWFISKSVTAAGHIQMGLIGIIYSLLNFLSVGLLGLFIEVNLPDFGRGTP